MPALISATLTGKTAKEKAQIKGAAIAEAVQKGEYKECAHCGDLFTHKDFRRRPKAFVNRKFCSQKCSYAHRGGTNNANYKGVIATAKCEKCGKPFSFQPSAQRGRFCSFNCVKSSAKVIARRTMVKKECKSCGKGFMGYKERIFCSKICMGVCNTGYLHYNWKGGVLNRQYHHRRRKAMLRGAEGSHTQEEWEALKEKYGHMCLCCKRCVPEIVLSLDHVVPIARGGTDDIGNIQPLCTSCNSRKRILSTDYRLIYAN